MHNAYQNTRLPTRIEAPPRVLGGKHQGRNVLLERVKPPEAEGSNDRASSQVQSGSSGLSTLHLFPYQSMPYLPSPSA